MDTAQFFSRWKLLSQPTQECQRIVKATQSMEREGVKGKLVGVGFGVLEGIDPNAEENFVCAGGGAHDLGSDRLSRRGWSRTARP